MEDLDRSDDARVQAAVECARKVAAALDRVLLLHCPDPETLKLVLPEQPDHLLQRRLDTAIATELVAAGVDVAVQVVDRAAYLAWLRGQESTPEWRTAYRDPPRLVRGTAALDLLGVPAAAVRPGRKVIAQPAGKGTPAERRVRTWLEDDPAFDGLLQPLLDDGRQGILDMAVRRMAEKYEDEDVENFRMTLLVAAEGGDIEPGVFAELLVTSVLVEPQAALPDPAPFAGGLAACGYFGVEEEVAMVPAWFDPDAIMGLTACALRKTLRDLRGGRTPSELKPLDRLPAAGAIVLLGVSVDRTPTPWEIAAGTLEEEDAAAPERAADPVTERREAAFETWCDGVLAANPDLIDILFPTVPSDLADALDDAVAETADAGEAAPSAEELRDFIEVAAREAGDEAVVCFPRIAGGRVELALYTASGRLLDTRDFGEPELGELPQELRAAIATMVPVVEQPPGTR